MSKTILLLEDDQKFRALLLPVLEARGYRVLEAGRVQDATKLLTERPDLIVVDGLLPDGDGTVWIKKLPETARKIPVVFISAFWKSLKDHRMLQRDLNVALIVHKPVTPDSLVEQLERLLGGRAAPALNPELQAEMDKLHVEYERELPAKLEELRRAIRVARANPLEDKLRRDARSLAHRLAGTAGSYGFADESTAAAVIEAQAIAAATAKPNEIDKHWVLAETTVSEALNVRIGKPVLS